MSGGGTETEAKFYVLNLDPIITRLHELEARLIQPRVLETNLRFDLPGGELRSEGRVLRLRQDTQPRLTYKGAGRSDHGILVREEIEFEVGDFEKARQFLYALGYHEIFSYEKYRTTYELEYTLIMLDELPYGDFVEIEGQTLEQIRSAADRLKINWNAAIEQSYTGLFEYARKSLQLSFRDLSFENFLDIKVKAADLNVQPADRS